MDNHKTVETKAQVLNSAFSEFHFHFELNARYHGEWDRVFIQRDGVSIGRITYQNGEVYYVKQYKPGDYKYDQNDNIFYLLDYYLATGQVYKQIDELHEKAVKIREEDFAAKMKWRAENPLPERYNTDGKGKERRVHRKRLFGRNVRHVMAQLIREEIGNKQGF